MEQELTSCNCTASSLTVTSSLEISYLPRLFFQAARGLQESPYLVELSVLKIT